LLSFGCSGFSSSVVVEFLSSSVFAGVSTSKMLAGDAGDDGVVGVGNAPITNGGDDPLLSCSTALANWYDVGLYVVGVTGPPITNGGEDPSLSCSTAEANWYVVGGKEVAGFAIVPVPCPSGFFGGDGHFKGNPQLLVISGCGGAFVIGDATDAGTNSGDDESCWDTVPVPSIGTASVFNSCFGLLMRWFIS